MKPLDKPRQIFLYVAPFLPLAFFKIWASTGPTPGSLATVAFLMLAYCVLLLLVALHWDKPTHADWVITFYFALASSGLLLWPALAGAFFARFAVTGIYSCLFAMAFFPPLLGLEPFTYHYARKYTAPEVWGHPIFIRINWMMNYVWAGIFAVCIAFSLYPSVITRALIPLGLILLFGMPFNLRFPDLYLKKLGLPPLAEQKKKALEAAASQESSPQPARLPESARDAIFNMPDLFNPQAAGDLKALVGFQVSGPESFEAYLNIGSGRCLLEDRPSRRPDLLIRTPAEVWLSIARRERDGQEAFLSQAYQAEGNLGLLLRMREIFRGPATDSTE